MQQFVNLGKVIRKNLANSKVKFFIISNLIGKTNVIICKNNFDTIYIRIVVMAKCSQYIASCRLQNLAKFASIF